MTTFTITIAKTIQCYADVEVEASNIEEALEEVRSQAENDDGVWEYSTFNSDWTSSENERVVSIAERDSDESYHDFDLTDEQYGQVICAKALAKMLREDGIISDIESDCTIEDGGK